MSLKKYFGLLVLILFSLHFNAQIQVNNATTPAQLVELLVGTGVSYSNVTFSGDPNQFGSFDENGANLGINQGVILGTGDVYHYRVVARGYDTKHHIRTGILTIIR